MLYRVKSSTALRTRWGKLTAGETIESLQFGVQKGNHQFIVSSTTAFVIEAEWDQDHPNTGTVHHMSGAIVMNGGKKSATISVYPDYNTVLMRTDDWDTVSH